jgi:hypothetical protein
MAIMLCIFLSKNLWVASYVLIQRLKKHLFSYDESKDDHHQFLREWR